PFYKLGQQVEIRVQARSASGHPFGAGSCRITARIEHLSSVGKRMRPTLVRMNPESGRPGWFLGRLKATTPGTFLVTVHATHRLLAPFRVGDLFEVDTARS
ncbi:MAG TPA: hypothetical protein VGB31_08290, partial [Myxococcota bacterium]